MAGPGYTDLCSCQRPYLLLGDLGQPYAWKRSSHPMSRQEEPSRDFSQGHASLWSSFLLLACNTTTPFPSAALGANPQGPGWQGPLISVSFAHCRLSGFGQWLSIWLLVACALDGAFHSLSLSFSGRQFQICPDLCPQSMAGSEDTTLLDFSPTPQLRVCVWGGVSSGVGAHATGGLSGTSCPGCTVLPSSLRIPACRAPVAFPYPAWVPPAPPSRAVLVPVLSQNRGLSFPFPVISQAPPSPQSGGRRPPSLPLCKPFLHSFYSWLEQPFPLSVPRKGMSGWSLVTGHWLLIAGWGT